MNPIPEDPAAGDPAVEVAQLRIALRSNRVIGQATGILMERHGIDADAAFERLVEMSQHSNVKVHDIAANLVALRTDLGDLPDADVATRLGPES